MKKRFKWTSREDKILVRAIDADPRNKAKAFRMFANKFKVTYDVPKNRWYNHLANPESKYYIGCRFTLVSSAVKYENRTRESKYVQPEKIEKSIWQKIKNLLGIK